MTPLPTLGGNNGVANWVNRGGTVVGQAENATVDKNCTAPQMLHFLPVVRLNGRATELRIEKGDADGIAFAINNSGQIVGAPGTAPRSTRFF